MKISDFGYRAWLPSALCVATLAFPIDLQAGESPSVCPQVAMPQAGNPASLPPDCPDPEPQPPPPPSIPSSITYPGYTNGDSVTVRWGANNSGSVIYTLEESVNNGGWTVAYRGSQTSTGLGGKVQSILRYRVRACTAGNTCSGYRTGRKMAVNPMHVPDLSARYPFLPTVDARNATYRSSARSFPTVLPRTPMPGRGVMALEAVGDERFYLGEGYDIIRGALKELCLEATHPQFVISRSAPLQPSTFDISHVTDNTHLAELLDVSFAARAGLQDDDFTLGVSGEKERYASATTDESHERFVVKWVQRSELWRLSSTPVDAIAPEIASDMLEPDSAPAKEDFRYKCGDQFINTVNLGAALYLVFSFDSKKYDSTERQSKAGQLGAAILETFNAGGAGSISTSTAQLLQQLNVQVHADQVGGPPGLAASIGSGNFNTKYNEFIQGINQSNWAAVDFTTTDYQRPTMYSAYSRERIFADYTVPYAQARRWLDLTVQVKERCAPYSDHVRPRPESCNTSETELGIALDLCRDTPRWGLCQHPNQYTPVFSSLGSIYLLGWMNENVKKLNPYQRDQSFTHHVHDGTLAVNDLTCLQGSQCFLSKFRGSGVGLGRGFKVTVTAYDNPRGTAPQYGVVNACVNTTASLRTGGFLGDTTADFNYSMQVEGFCADTVALSIVP